MGRPAGETKARRNRILPRVRWPDAWNHGLGDRQLHPVRVGRSHSRELLRGRLLHRSSHVFE